MALIENSKKQLASYLRCLAMHRAIATQLAMPCSYSLQLATQYELLERFRYYIFQLATWSYCQLKIYSIHCSYSYTLCSQLANYYYSHQLSATHCYIIFVQTLQCNYIIITCAGHKQSQNLMYTMYTVQQVIIDEYTILLISS